MRAGNGLLTLLIRLVSGRLRHDLGAYAKREARLITLLISAVLDHLLSGSRRASR